MSQKGVALKKFSQVTITVQFDFTVSKWCFVAIATFTTISNYVKMMPMKQLSKQWKGKTNDERRNNGNSLRR